MKKTDSTTVVEFSALEASNYLVYSAIAYSGKTLKTFFDKGVVLTAFPIIIS